MQVKGTRLWCMLVEYVEDNYYAMFYDPSYHKPRSCAQFAICTPVQICTRVYFWPCERCLKKLHPGANLLLLSQWCKFICTRVQICSQVQIVHMNAKCLISLHFDGGFRYMACLFYYNPV